MTIKAATPYIIASGRAERAIALYEKALGAKVQTLQRFGDVDKSCPEANKKLVMHCDLRAGDARLMLSDGPGEGPIAKEGAVSIALAISDPGQLRKTFDVLAETGAVLQKLIDAPWGGLFGVVIDEVGVSWMFSSV